MCVWAPSHTGVHGVESDVRLTRSVDRLASPGDEQRFYSSPRVMDHRSIT
jgi:hypothetical protein